MRLSNSIKLLLPCLMLVSTISFADTKSLAPGFDQLPKGATMVIMQPDVELFSISAGGVLEPKADWTESANKHLHDALIQKISTLGLAAKELDEASSDDLAELNSLHGAVAQSIALHHSLGGVYALPTKDKKLDWSLGDAIAPLHDKSGADFALFIWVRDSYASSERKAAMIALALLGVGVQGGAQIGYASLVNLKTGQVLWFNQLLRGTGDLRDSTSATETVSSLLNQFPTSKSQ